MIKKHFMKLAVEELEKEELATSVMENGIQSDSDECEEHPDFTAVTKAEDDIDEHLDYISEVVCDVGDVEAIAEFTEETATQGGADAVTAEILQIGSESLYERLGVRPAKVVLSVENFGSKLSKQEGTKLAIEGFKEFIKNMWEAIKAAFKKMSNYLTHYVKMVFNLNTFTIRAANSLNDNMKKTPITAQNKALLAGTALSVKVSGYMFSLSMPENENSFGDLNKDLQKSTLVFAKSAKIINNFTNYLSSNQDLKDLIKDEESFSAIKYPDLSEGFQKVKSDVWSQAVHGIDDTKNYFKSENMIGSRAIYITEPGDSKTKVGREAIKAIEETSIKLAGTINVKSSFKEEAGFYQIDAMNPMAFSEIIKTIIFVCDKISGSEKGYLDLVLKHDEMINEIDAVEKMLTQSEEDYAEYKTRVAAIRTFSNSVNRLTGELIKAVSGSLTKACHTSTVYVNQSYKAYLRHQ